MEHILCGDCEKAGTICYKTTDICCKEKRAQWKAKRAAEEAAMWQNNLCRDCYFHIKNRCRYGPIRSSQSYNKGYYPTSDNNLACSKFKNREDL